MLVKIETAQKDIVIGKTDLGIAKNKETIKILDKIKTSLSTLDISKYGNLKQKFKELDQKDLTEEERDKILVDILKELKNHQTLKDISKDLQEQDKQKGTNTYEEFRKTIINIDPSFIPIIIGIESGTTDAKAQIILGVSNLSGVDIGKNILSKITDDGFEIQAGKDGRTLAINSSDFKLNANIDTSKEQTDIEEIKTVLIEKVEPINKTLSYTLSILKYLDEANINQTSFEEIKLTIKNQNLNYYNQLDIDNATSIQDIKQKLINQKKKDLDEIILTIINKAQKQDKKTKETLKVIKALGIDNISHTVLEKLQKMLIMTPVQMPDGKSITKLILSPSFKIEGSSITSSEGINNARNREILAIYINIAISGNPNYPIKKDSVNGAILAPTFVNENGETISRPELTIYINEKLGLNGVGGNPSATMMKNILENNKKMMK